MSTNSIASAAELEVIKQWLKKTAGLGEITEVEPRLPQSKSFLKVLGVLYWDSKTSLPIIPAQVAEALSSSPLFEGVTLASMPHIMKCLLSGWTFGTLRRGPRVRHLLTAHLILGVILLQSGGLLCTMEWPSVVIVGMPVMLKALNVRNVVVLIELRTTDCWLGVVRPIPSPTLLGR